MKILQIIPGVVMVFVILSFAKEKGMPPPVGTIAVKNGMLVYSNLGEDFFTFKIRGKKIVPFQENGIFFMNVDGKGMQYTIVPFSNFLSPDEMKNENDTLVLRKHLDFESEHIEKMLKTHPEITKINKICKDGRPILVWSFKMPDQGENVKMQLCVTTVVKSHVLMLNGIIVNEADYKKMCKLLEDGMATLQLREAAITPEAFKDSSVQKN